LRSFFNVSSIGLLIPNELYGENLVKHPKFFLNLFFALGKNSGVGRVCGACACPGVTTGSECLE